MSERMIEMHRARLLNKNGGAQPIANQNGAPPVAQTAPSPQQAKPQLPPKQAAVAAMQTEDSHMKLFLQRLQTHRDDTRPSEALFSPTVPTGLSRRILNRQGAGFLDPTVAAIGSAAADRFLATVLQQSITCRDQRVKGMELTRQAARERKRHRRHYEESVNDRSRRKEELESEREKFNVAAIQAAEALKHKGSPAINDVNEDAESAAGGNAKTKKKKKVSFSSVNGIRKREDFEDIEGSYDSLDEEQEFYQQYEEEDDDDDAESVSDEEDDGDETIVLWDLARPLAAWDFHFDGKVGMDPYAENENDDDNSVGGESLENDGAEDMEVDNSENAVGEEDENRATTLEKASPDSDEEKKHTRKASTSSPIAASGSD